MDVQMNKCLAALSNPKRLEIYKMLKNCDGKTPFSDILKHVYNDDSAKSSSLSNHLGKLVECCIIDKNNDGYSLSVLGNQLVSQITNLEKIFLHYNKKLMVRTSDYCLEPFDENKIVSHLTTEGHLSNKDAQYIASITKTRLLDAGLNYLTAPLIREFVNVILLENNFEDERHKLTRLGLPPEDISNLMQKSSFKDVNEFYIELGKNIVEQNLLLNHLPQRYADFYLSGALFLNHPESWSINTSELVLPGPHFADIIIKQVAELNDLYNQSYKIQNFALSLRSLFENFKQFFNRGIVLTNFQAFLEKLGDYFDQKPLEVANLFFRFLPKINIVTNLDARNFHNNNWEMWIEILVENLDEPNDILKFILDLYQKDVDLWDQNSKAENGLQRMLKVNKIMKHRPNIIIRFNNHCTKLIKEHDQSNEIPSVLQKLFSIVERHCISCIFSDPDLKKEKNNTIFTPYLVPLQIPMKTFADQKLIPRPKIVLDKIFVNLTRIIQECEEISESPYDNAEKDYEKDTNKFKKALRQWLFHAMNLFARKYKLLIQNLPNFKRWEKISKLLFKRDLDFSTNELDDYIGKIEITCGICLNGLVEAVRFYTGFYPDQNQNAFDFMMEIINFSSKILRNNSNNSNVNYQLVQGHLDNYLETHFIQDAEILKKMSKEFAGVDHKETESLFDTIKKNKFHDKDPAKNYTITNFMNQNMMLTSLKKFHPYWVQNFRSISLVNYESKLQYIKRYQDESGHPILLTIDSDLRKKSNFEDLMALFQKVSIEKINCLSFNSLIIIEEEDKSMKFYRYCGCYKPVTYFTKMLQNKILSDI